MLVVDFLGGKYKDYFFFFIFDGYDGEFFFRELGVLREFEVG